jgi:hypothetical protein
MLELTLTHARTQKRQSCTFTPRYESRIGPREKHDLALSRREGSLEGGRPSVRCLAWKSILEIRKNSTSDLSATPRLK